ncbi:MAG: hypothetical protein A3F12_08000 [Gammaproteobacteria bacterium RIFCSPHIGHO2_12_FULL_38_14]|nr:MAG: hypothetical protein A3F12_08000 [Gammaproteobacteria bacterium RIFCSPHIGHO2_12_FULL_38_14]
MSKSRLMGNNGHNNDEILWPFLSLLPSDIRCEIYRYSPLRKLGLLAQTSKQYEAETASLRLLQASIHAVPAFLDAEKDVTALAAIVLFKTHLELLFIKKKVTDHHGREICASPYQIFFGAGDIWALKQIQKDILPLIENGEAQAEVQFKEWFPNCPWPLPENFSEEMLYDDRNKHQIKEIVKQLATVKQLIDVDPFNYNKPLDTTKQAVEMLCKLFQPKPGEVIRSGLHFPLGIMKEIYKTCRELQHNRSFFSQVVIKPALVALSTVDGQCCQGGLKDLNMEAGPNRRCHPFYQHPLGQPLSLTLVDDKDGCGVAAFVDPYNGEVFFVAFPSGSLVCFNKNGRESLPFWSMVIGEFWETLMENKGKSLLELCCHTKRSNTLSQRV